MKTRVSRTLVPSLLFAATLVVALNTWFAFRSESILLDNEFWVRHTWQVIYQVERIMGSAKDAESSARGYLLTADESYLQPYRVAVHDLPAELEQFGSLTSDNASQGVRLKEMRAVLDQRLALLNEAIESHRNGGSDTERALLLSGSGKLEMEHLRGVGDRVEEEERRLLARRTAATRQAAFRSRLTLGLASALDFLLIVLVFRFLSNERAMRISSEEAAERLALSRAQTEANAAEILKLNETLEERVNLRTAELATTNRELEAFSYSVSHDLRAPLRTIDGFSLALEEDYAGVVDEMGRDYIRRVRSGVQRMGELIDALLQLSRITRAEIAREQVDLSQLARTISADLLAGPDRNRVTFLIEDGLEAFADPKLLQVALENLLGNAVKFSSKREHATIELGRDESQNAWFIRDNGAGFDMYYADRLFNAFNRLHGDKDFKGSGIGLATVARVIQRHHGRIWADSVVDRGATFWFTLG